MNWFVETLYADWQQRFPIARELYRKKTEFQDLAIFETPFFGRILALDGVVQTTERDEFFYHEMLAHVPLFGHAAPRQVLIIGGGDGGSLREVLRHPVERATMVEIDRTVIDLCAEYMPSLSAGAFDDPRTDLVITDGVRYVAETDRRFDVIIVDSTDPVGPGEVLFTADFYAGCKRCLNPGGILATQSGVPFHQPEELQTGHRNKVGLFPDVTCYLTAVPTYVGGHMTLGWATLDPGLRPFSEEAIAARFHAAGFTTRYYTPAAHVAAFALPAYIRDLLADAS